jgi:hypothetical protein
MHLLAERFGFWGVMIKVFERWNQDLSSDTNVASKLAFFVFTSIVYGVRSYSQQSQTPSSR